MEAEVSFKSLGHGTNGLVLVNELDDPKVAIKCCNYYITTSDGNSVELNKLEKNYVHAKYYNNQESVEVLTSVLPTATIECLNQTLADFKQEFDVLTKLKNKPNVVQLIGLYTHGPMVGFQMELFPMNLHTWIHGNTYTVDLVNVLTKQLLTGLNAIHEIKCAHLDIKPANILYDPTTCTVKIADFGNSSFTIPTNHRDCTVGYRAPELYLKTPFKSMEDVFLLDVWSLGCVVYELLFKRRCFEKQLVRKYNERMFTDGIAYVMIEALDTHNVLLLQVVSKMITWKAHRKNAHELIEIYNTFL